MPKANREVGTDEAQQPKTSSEPTDTASGGNPTDPQPPKSDACGADSPQRS